MTDTRILHFNEEFIWSELVEDDWGHGEIPSCFLHHEGFGFQREFHFWLERSQLVDRDCITANRWFLVFGIRATESGNRGNSPRLLNSGLEYDRFLSPPPMSWPGRSPPLTLHVVDSTVWPHGCTAWSLERSCHDSIWDIPCRSVWPAPRRDIKRLCDDILCSCSNAPQSPAKFGINDGCRTMFPVPLLGSPRDSVQPCHWHAIPAPG